MSDQTKDNVEENELSPTITIAEKEGASSAETESEAMPTITIAEKDDDDD